MIGGNTRFLTTFLTLGKSQGYDSRRLVLQPWRRLGGISSPCLYGGLVVAAVGIVFTLPFDSALCDVVASTLTPIVSPRICALKLEKLKGSLIRKDVDHGTFRNKSSFNTNKPAHSFPPTAEQTTFWHCHIGFRPPVSCLLGRFCSQ